MDISRIELERINVLALRTIARQMGIKSPTIKKKQELIEEILKVSNGCNEETTPKNTRGRPCLNAFDGSDIISFSPINFTEEYIKDYINKVEVIFDEYIKKMTQIKEKYLNKVLKISQTIAKNPPR